ncbi:hypothetical protein AAG906_021603 [Vitis piasezkii]
MDIFSLPPHSAPTPPPSPPASSPGKPTPPLLSVSPPKLLLNPTNLRTPPATSAAPKPSNHPSTPLLQVLKLPKSLKTSQLSPPPPPTRPPQETIDDKEVTVSSNLDNLCSDGSPEIEFRQEGKIFVGNLPNWVKKNEVSEFFRQFGPIENVILIKGHNDNQRNAGFGFVIYGGPMASGSAMRAVEFDGVEFHGRVLTVKLDDGRRLRGRSEERVRWVQGHGVDQRSKWHEERESSRKDFRKVLETEPENWQAVVQAFERIKKPSRKEFGLMVTYYARRGICIMHVELLKACEQGNRANLSCLYKLMVACLSR